MSLCNSSSPDTEMMYGAGFQMRERERTRVSNGAKIIRELLYLFHLVMMNSGIYSKTPDLICRT